jgi:phage terminase small subunit
MTKLNPQLSQSLMPLLTHKQRQFARHVSDGCSLAAAYRSAYNTNARPSTVRVEACRLNRKPGIAAEIKRLTGNERHTGSASQNGLSTQDRLRALIRQARSLGLMR